MAGQSSEAPRSVGLARHGVDVADRLEAFEQAAELGEALHLDDGGDHRGAVVVDLDVGAAEVDLRLGDDAGDVTEQPGAIPGLDLDGHRVELPGAALPLHLDHPRRVDGVDDVDAARAVDADPLATGDVAANRFAGQGFAALGDDGEHVADVAHPDL